FFQAEDGIRDRNVTGVQTCALPIFRVQVRYRRPARYDDLLTLRTTVTRTSAVKIEHHYTLLRDGEVLAEGESTLGCVDRNGQVQIGRASCRERGEESARGWLGK